MLFPVWRLRGRVGEIRWEQSGLYWEYTARLFAEADGFVRLFLHAGEKSVRLGLFHLENGVPSLCGRISIHALKHLCEPFSFSILQEAYLPPAVSNSPLPFCAKRIDGGWEYCIPLEEINDAALPYFCFFRPSVVDGRSCVLLTQDREGKPSLPQISP